SATVKCLGSGWQIRHPRFKSGRGPSPLPFLLPVVLFPGYWSTHRLPCRAVEHRCRQDFARELVAGRVGAEEWKMSQNDYDWLGEGIYFWEHAPGRAWQWARERYGGDGAVVATEVRLGRCLDLADTEFTGLLREAYEDIVNLYTS